MKRGIPPRSRTARLGAAAILSTALVAIAATPALAHDRGRDAENHGDRFGQGAVYTETNDPTANAVIVFARNHDGTIGQRATVPTGGKGLAAQPPFGFPITDSQGALNLTDGGRLLFAVNAGDNTISAFQVTGHGLRLVNRVASGGTEPISLTSSGDVLYVLNENSGNIAGFRFSWWGGLWPIPGSSQPLSTPGPSAISAQIGFSPDGRLLTVSERCYSGGCAGQPKGVLDTFVVDRFGRAGAAHQHPSNDDGPFGFAYASPSKLIVSNTGAIQHGTNPPDPGDPTLFIGTTSSYSVDRFGNLAPNGGPVAAGGRGSCWVVLTGDGRYAFVTNSLSTFPPGNGVGGVSRYAVSHNGTLTLLGQTDVSGDPVTPGTAFPTDEVLSSDSRYLYVVSPTLAMGPANNATSHIDVYRVGSGGALTHIQTTPATLATGVSGMASS
jgi:6-phosphogluconolactonase